MLCLATTPLELLDHIIETLHIFDFPVCECDAIKIINYMGVLLGGINIHYSLKSITSKSLPTCKHVSRVRRLYKLIFRVHRALPAELRILGDNYAREEFKRHKTCNSVEAKIFLMEWTNYAINLARQTKPLHQAKSKTVGKYLDPEVLDYMRDEQLIQLYELHEAAFSDTPDNPNETTLSSVQDTEKRT